MPPNKIFKAKPSKNEEQLKVRDRNYHLPPLHTKQAPMKFQFHAVPFVLLSFTVSLFGLIEADLNSDRQALLEFLLGLALKDNDKVLANHIANKDKNVESHNELLFCSRVMDSFQ